MPVPIALLALLVAAPISLPPGTAAINAVPDEPGAFVLPDAPILQTVAADMDGDGHREVVRLINGDDDAVLAEVWVERDPSWTLLGEPIEVVPSARVGPRIDDVYLATPVRLLVRRVAGAERVTVASQPHFEEIDIGEPCCLLLRDIVIEPGGVARRVDVSGALDFADTVLVIDFDGDGTDELLSTQSLPPAGDISYPTVARVHRWMGDGFAAPVETRLEVGSGDSPFLLGDSDERPGQEAAIISTLGRSGLFRISATAGDGLAIDDAGVIAEQALAVPVGTGRGVAVAGPLVGLAVATWPSGGPIGETIGTSQLSDGRFLGTIEVEGDARLAVHRPSSSTLHLLGLPDLEPWRETAITRSLVAARLSARPPVPYVGLLPDGGARDAPASAVMHAGRLVLPTAAGDASTPTLMGTLAGAEPIALVGAGDDLALHHAPFGPASIGPGGGPLLVPSPAPLAWTSIVPFDLVRTGEAAGGSLDATTQGALSLDGGNDIGVGADGFTAEVAAPPGSRVLVSDGTTLGRAPAIVPEGGIVELRLGGGTTDGTTSRIRTRLVVTTPAGHAYVAAWDVVVRAGPPQVEVVVSTPFGSSEVAIAGRTVTLATVRVDGRPVAVDPNGAFATRVELPPWPTEVVIEVDDSLGNLARTTVTGVGWLDYRALPWVAISIAVLGIAAVILLLRVPHAVELPRRADDDAALEELEPD
jgi:hypothetical protein